MISKKFPTRLIVKLVAEASTEDFGLTCQVIVTEICALVCPLKTHARRTSANLASNDTQCVYMLSDLPDRNCVLFNNRR